MHIKRVKIENCAPDDEVQDFDESIRDSQGIIKWEPDWDSQIGNDSSTSAFNFEQDAGLVPESDVGADAKWEVYFQSGKTEIDCYDFNELVGINQRRMKEEARNA